MHAFHRTAGGILVATLVLTSAACGKPGAFLHVYDACEPLVLAPAADATDQQLASVADAVAMWDAVASTSLTLARYPAAAELPIVFVDSNLYLGAYDDQAQVVRLARRVDDEHAMAVVLAHELGHAFDLFHVSRTSVMKKGNWKTEPTSADAADLAAQWGPCVHR